LKYFEDYNLSLTQRLGKIAILGQPPGGSCAEVWRFNALEEIYTQSP